MANCVRDKEVWTQITITLPLHIHPSALTLLYPLSRSADHVLLIWLLRISIQLPHPFYPSFLIFSSSSSPIVYFHQNEDGQGGHRICGDISISLAAGLRRGLAPLWLKAFQLLNKTTTIGRDGIPSSLPPPPSLTVPGSGMITNGQFWS